MRIFDLALKDLSQIFRDKKSLLFLVAMPSVFTLFMGFAYNGGDGVPKDNRLSLAWVEAEPGSTLSQKLWARLEASDAVQPIRIILFGSSARGERKPQSDLDILVVAPLGTHCGKACAAIYRQLIGFGYPVDVVVAPPPTPPVTEMRESSV